MHFCISHTSGTSTIRFWGETFWAIDKSPPLCTRAQKSLWSPHLGTKSVPWTARPASPPEDREAGWGSARDPGPGSPPDLIPIPAQPHPGFQSTSRNVCFVIWKMELMIPALQDYFAGLRVPLTPIYKRRWEIRVSAESYCWRAPGTLQSYPVSAF